MEHPDPTHPVNLARTSTAELERRVDEFCSEGDRAADRFYQAALEGLPFVYLVPLPVRDELPFDLIRHGKVPAAELEPGAFDVGYITDESRPVEPYRRHATRNVYVHWPAT